jgi:hypothetical protein
VLQRVERDICRSSSAVEGPPHGLDHLKEGIGLRGYGSAPIEQKRAALFRR